MSPATKLVIRPIEPDSAADVAELCAQREACGWGLPGVPGYMQAVKRGDMLYYLLYLSDGVTEHGPIGSGGLDLSGASEPTLASRERAEFCIMGLCLLPEYRSKGFSRRIARYLINYGFERLNQKTCGVMTMLQNPLTNHMFPNFGFVEFHRQPEPEWIVEGAWSVSYRLTRNVWQQYLKSLDAAVLENDAMTVELRKAAVGE
ncbi:protein of unknown function [Taphrina deformans PYCC 5710]|uniref:N-acetyltransferase domain-containing protein n=1 Tax=Taphrina deformans (strain PYCC 5710 / ATCC 11124 / CBS 356.35 / IMI 108563 / JCM 9778 / NBRC 8474) TaxID=1097556 RepID=S0BE65_TAPDE|nr:protein of unknown function [Taphrina deformans PYCC 5710]|eukprot:CCG84899.1 protein of unknown function [Taphrina deformans PYCC 5710]